MTSNYDINRHREDVRNFTSSINGTGKSNIQDDALKELIEREHKDCYSLEVITKYLDRYYAPVPSDLQKRLDVIKGDLE